MTMRKQIYAGLPFAALAVLAFMYLAVTSQDLFYVAQSQDMFVYDVFHFNRIAQSPGFVVQYAGSFFTQFAYYPVLGISLFVALLVALSLLVAWAFRLPGKGWSLALIPGVLIVLYLSRWDYGVFSMRQYGNLFSPEVGLLLQVAWAGLYARMKNRTVRYVWSGVTVAVLYPLLGCYALMAAVEAILMDVFVLKRMDWIHMAASVVLIIFVPVIEVRLFFDNFNTRYLLVAGLPYLDFYSDTTQTLPLYLSLASALLISACGRWIRAVGERVAYVLSATCAAVAVACVPIYANKDSNFHTLIAVEHAYDMGDTDKVLELCAAQERPIRPIIMYRNIELYRRGELLDRMFRYTWQSDTICSKNERMGTMIVAPRVCEQYTFWNFSYRWAMERYVKYKPSYIDTRIMAKDCIYNGETEVADKYLSKLDNTLFYRDWADRQRRLLDKKTLRGDSIYKLHSQLVVVPPGALDNTPSCEYMLVKHFCNLYVNTHERAVMSIAAALVSFNEDVFWKMTLAKVKANPGATLPVHVQEAALLFTLKRNNPRLMQQIKLMVGADGQVCQQFERNIDLLTRLCTQPTQTDVETLRTLCPGTYWTYYFHDGRQAVIFD